MEVEADLKTEYLVKLKIDEEYTRPFQNSHGWTNEDEVMNLGPCFYTQIFLII